MNLSKLKYQNYGSSILIFISGSPAEVQGQWLSLYNWGATSSNIDWVTKNVGSCWSTKEKLKNYLINVITTRLMKPKHNKSWSNISQLMDEAAAQAETIFTQIEQESFRSVNNANNDFYEEGVICAEREDLDFKDECVKYSFANRD